MALGKRIITAFASSKIKIRVIRFSWTNEFFPNYFDIGFNFEFQGKTFSGRGTDRSEELAFIKASMEAIERCVCSQYKIHSNGVAAHFDRDSAKINAQSELIERDVALCHFLTQIPYEAVDLDEIQIKNAVQKFAKLGIQFNFFRMRGTRSLCPTIAIASGLNARMPFGLILGLGCKARFEDSIASSFIECVRNLTYILKCDSIEVLSEMDFYHAEAIPNSHFKYALHFDTPFRLESFLSTSSCELNIEQDNKNNQFHFEELDLGFLNLKLENLFVVRAKNPFLQNMFYGQTTAALLNFSRLSEFAQKNLLYDNILKTPHIYG